MAKENLYDPRMYACVISWHRRATEKKIEIDAITRSVTTIENMQKQHYYILQVLKSRKPDLVFVFDEDTLVWRNGEGNEIGRQDMSTPGVIPFLNIAGKLSLRAPIIMTLVPEHEKLFTKDMSIGNVFTHYTKVQCTDPEELVLMVDSKKRSWVQPLSSVLDTYGPSGLLRAFDSSTKNAGDVTIDGKTVEVTSFSVTKKVPVTSEEDLEMYRKFKDEAST